MASLRSVWLLLALFAGLMGSLKAYQFNVGGKDGWVQNPSESYSSWSSRMRFQINDALCKSSICIRVSIYIYIYIVINCFTENLYTLMWQ